MREIAPGHTYRHVWRHVSHTPDLATAPTTGARMAAPAAPEYVARLTPKQLPQQPHAPPPSPLSAARNGRNAHGAHRREITALSTLLFAARALLLGASARPHPQLREGPAVCGVWFRSPGPKCRGLPASLGTHSRSKNTIYSLGARNPRRPSRGDPRGALGSGDPWRLSRGRGS